MWDFKNLCGVILCGQPKVKKVSVLHYRMTRIDVETLLYMSHGR